MDNLEANMMLNGFLFICQVEKQFKNFQAATIIHVNKMEGPLRTPCCGGCLMGPLVMCGGCVMGSLGVWRVCDETPCCVWIVCDGTPCCVWRVCDGTPCCVWTVEGVWWDTHHLTYICDPASHNKRETLGIRANTDDCFPTAITVDSHPPAALLFWVFSFSHHSLHFHIRENLM